MDAKQLVNCSLLYIWYAGAAAELVCFSLLARRQLTRKYPALSTYLLVTGGKSAFLIWEQFAFGKTACDLWTVRLAAVDIALYSAITVECIVAMAKHWPGIKWVALILSGIALLISGAATWITACIGAGVESHMPHAVLILRYHATALLLVLLLMRGFFGIAGSTVMRRNVQTYAGLLILMLASHVVGAGIWYVGERDYALRAAAQYINLGTALLCYALWAFELRPAGEAFTPPPKPDPETLAMLEEEERELQEELLEARGFPR